MRSVQSNVHGFSAVLGQRQPLWPKRHQFRSRNSRRSCRRGGGRCDGQVTNQSTGSVSRATTDSAGLFRVVNILTGTYFVRVQAKGFKNLTVRDIVVDASDAHDLGRLQLSLGEVTESVSVTAQVAAVETASSERAPLLDNSQLNIDAIKGRDLMSYMKLLARRGRH